MPANISALFEIDVLETIAAGASKTITNPGRTFRVIQVLVTGLNTATCTVKKNTGAGATVSTATLATGDLNAFPSTITPADSTFTATDNIHIAAGVADLSRVTLLCAAADAQALTVT